MIGAGVSPLMYFIKTGWSGDPKCSKAGSGSSASGSGASSTLRVTGIGLGSTRSSCDGKTMTI